jgi:hypothetical protein
MIFTISVMYADSFQFIGYWGFFLGVKHLGREAEHSPPFSDEVNNKWSKNSTFPVCVHCVYRDTFTLITKMFNIFTGITLKLG